jgi:hypothetical protein
MEKELIKKLTEFYIDKKTQLLREMKEIEKDNNKSLYFLEDDIFSPFYEIEQKLIDIFRQRERYLKIQGELNAIEEIWKIISTILNVQIQEEIKKEEIKNEKSET